MLEYLPPRQQHCVTIDGFAVPHIEAREIEQTQEVNIFLDERFGMTVPAEIAEQVIWMLANALAIGAGYSCHGENSRRSNPFKVRVTELDPRDLRP